MKGVLFNEFMSCRVSIVDDIKIGLAATRFVGTDRYAAVVTEIISDKRIRIADMEDDDYNSLDDKVKVQMLEAVRMKKYTSLDKDRKSWIIVGDIFSYRKNGRWIKEGDDLWDTSAIHLGHAENYRDPNF